MSKSGHDDFSVDQISKQLQQILASDVFNRSERHSRFLEYIVTHALEGRTSRLKGYTIGLDVFDRDQEFDPNVDSIVRVEAGRLRTKLHEYYRNVGRDDALVIDLPKGAYVPVFYRNKSPEPPVKTEKTIDKWIATRKPVAALAVLPLTNHSGDSEPDYFSDGFTEAIIIELAKIPVLRVISMTSMMCYKGTGKPVKQIAKELDVTHVLSGSITREGNHLRVSVHLIQGSSDFHVWAENYERELQDLIQIQQELAQAIAGQLSIELKPDPDTQGTLNSSALEAYLLGRRYRNELTVDGYHKAREYFSKAIQLDPNYSQAYTGMASCLCALGSHGFEVDDPRELIPEGLSNAQAALLLDEHQHEAHAFMGIMLLKYSWDWTGAEYSFRRALELNPSDVRATMQYSMYFETLAEFDKAIELAQAAQAVDPMSKAVQLNIAWQYFQAGDFVQSEKLFLDLIQSHPQFWGGHWGLGQVYRETHRPEDAVRSLQRGVLLSGGYPLTYQTLGHFYGKTGQQDKAMKVIEELERKAVNMYVSPFSFATIYAGMGAVDACFDWLEKAYDLRSRSMAWLYVTREYTDLRQDPRYIDLIKRIGVPAKTG